MRLCTFFVPFFTEFYTAWINPSGEYNPQQPVSTPDSVLTPASAITKQG